MKFRILNVMYVVILAATSLPSMAWAAPGACANEKSSLVSNECREELVRLMDQDKDSIAVRRALEESHPLVNCRAHSQEIKFVNDEAVGPTLELSSFIACDAETGADGYIISGQYFIEGGGYLFKQLTLSTAE